MTDYVDEITRDKCGQELGFYKGKLAKVIAMCGECYQNHA